MNDSPAPAKAADTQTDPRLEDEQATAQAALKTGIPYFDTRSLETAVTVDDIIPFDVLIQYKVAPLERYSKDALELGLTAATDTKKLPDLQATVPHVKLTFKTISQSGLTWIYNHTYYQAFESDRGGDFEGFGRKLQQTTPKQSFEFIAQLAYWLGASDIHIEPQAETTRIRFRLDGILHPITNVATQAYQIFLSDLQTRASITWGSDKPQSGRISFDLMDNNSIYKSVNMRIETLPAFHGEEIVVRIFNDETRSLTLDTMGFNQAQVDRLNDVIAHPNGLVLTVGPTGSGKTSTLYSLINTLNNPEVKIVTLEDPVEYDLAGISQIPVHTEDAESFADKLRAVMREDPDVVMIGEIRDIDTSKTALQAALTGHLVLSTFHATNAAAAISRMLDMIGQNPLFASAVRMIIAQRLARRVCDACAVTAEPTAEEMKFIEKAAALLPSDRTPDLPPGLKLRHGTGCPVCHGLGYKGRVAIVEMMPITPEIEKLMTSPQKTTASAIEQAAVTSGMATLVEDGLKKALSGVTTIEEIVRLGEV